MLTKLLPITAAASCALAAIVGTADAAPRQLAVPSAVRVAEGAETRIKVTLPKAARARTLVRWSIAAPDDFVRTRGTVRIARGRRTGTVRLVTRQDALREADERFTLKVGRRSVRVTIADDDAAPAVIAAGSGSSSSAPAALQPSQPEPSVVPPTTSAPSLPVVSVGDLSRGEGAGDTSQPALALSHPSAQDVTVSWAYSDGTAQAGKDYAEMEGTTTIKAGKTTASLPIQILADIIDEDHSETFDVTLSAPQNATIGKGSGVITIVDDDPKPALFVHDGALRLENATTMPFTVTLNRPTIHAVTVKVYTANGSAMSGATCAIGVDFVTTSATLTFAPGETSKTVQVTVCEDGMPEGDETVKLKAYDLSEWAVMGDAEGVGTIQQDGD